jgi:dipeptidyl aminopeptidase/acylaminoacyl peptidase
MYKPEKSGFKNSQTRLEICRIRGKGLSFAPYFFLCALIFIMMNPAFGQEEVWKKWLETAPPVPEFKPPSSLHEWEKQRTEIRQRLWMLLGKLPERPKELKIRIVEKRDSDGYRLEKFVFDNGAGDDVPGYLLLPLNASAENKYPAILYCHWHGGQYDVGKEELFRTNAVCVPPGPELVKNGYIVIAIDACCFGERNGKGPGGVGEKGGAGEMTASKFNLWVGRTLWGMMLRDDLIALDYLCSRPEVNTNRIGVTGISMGATRTWWLMALDERLKTGVAVCCLTRYQNLIQTKGLKYHGIYYFVPGVLNYFDTEAVVALSAPRPLLFQSGELDEGSPVEGIKIIESKAREVYQLYGKEENFRSIIYENTGHVYTPEMWKRTLAWFDEKLKKQ